MLFLFFYFKYTKNPTPKNTSNTNDKGMYNLC